MATRAANTHERRCSRVPPFLVGLLIFWFADAQSESPPGTGGTTFGSVVGRATREGRPAAFANVLVIGTRIGTLAREDGWFQLDKVPVGTRVIQFQAVGCVKASVSLEVKPGSHDTISVDLECPLMRCFRQEDPTADCFRPNEEERRRVGLRCRVHSLVVLASDTVRIGYGLQIARPEFMAAQSDSFTSARDAWDGGCVLEMWAFTEVAYCSECRRAHERWLRRTGRHE